MPADDEASDPVPSPATAPGSKPQRLLPSWPWGGCGQHGEEVEVDVELSGFGHRWSRNKVCCCPVRAAGRAGDRGGSPEKTGVGRGPPTRPMHGLLLPQSAGSVTHVKQLSVSAFSPKRLGSHSDIFWSALAAWGFLFSVIHILAFPLRSAGPVTSIHPVETSTANARRTIIRSVAFVSH